MTERSGPIYEIARERGRIISEAYRAAGEPRDVTEWRTPDGMVYVHRISRGPRKWQEEPATEAQWRTWRAWRTWCTERERLRQELRSKTIVLARPKPLNLLGTGRQERGCDPDAWAAAIDSPHRANRQA